MKQIKGGLSKMAYLTVRDLKRILEKYDDDSKIAVKARTHCGDALYYDLKCNNTPSGRVFYLHSEGLDLTIKSDREMLKEEMRIW